MQFSSISAWLRGSSRRKTPIISSPLIYQIRKHVMAASKLHADDTPGPVLAPRMGKTKTARLWTYVSDDRPAHFSAGMCLDECQIDHAQFFDRDLALNAGLKKEPDEVTD